MKNETLKQDIKHLEREELERLLIEEVEQTDKVYASLEEKQQRIDKAIEYIKKYQEIQAKNCYVDFDNEDIDKLLEILGGD